MADSIEPTMQIMMLRTFATMTGLTLGLFVDPDLLIEASVSGYARQALTMAVKSSPPPILARNSNTITFPNAPVAWGTIHGVGIFSSTGNLLYRKKLKVPQVIAAGQAFPVINPYVLEIGFV